MPGRSEAAEGDTLSVLAAQTTVAIRNATLYSEIPLRAWRGRSRS
jgi:hypothetical protein